MYPSTFSSDGVESSLDIIANDRNDFESIKMALTQNHIKIYNALIYGLYRDFFNKNIDYQEELVKGDDTYVKGGFVEKKLQYFQPTKFNQTRWSFNDRQFKFFEKSILLIKEQGIPFILVQAPITKSRYESYSNNSEFDDKMKSYGVYYNFNELIDLNDELDFYDSHHLNQNGVRIFNTKLIQMLFEK